MGIDLGFSRESRAGSTVAKCNRYLRKMIGFYDEPDPDSADPWTAGREPVYELDVARLRQERPDTYDHLASELPLLSYSQSVELRPTGPRSQKLVQELEDYLIAGTSPVVMLRKLTEPQRAEARAAIGADYRISAWDRLAFDKRSETCAGCPVRPSGESDCYLRFSSYPAMDRFRAEFLLAVGFAATLTPEDLANSPVWYRYIDDAREETPADKLAPLRERLVGAEIRRGAEPAMNLVVAMLGGLRDEANTPINPLDQTYRPFVDEFISTYLYRDDLVTPAEAKELLPYIGTLRDVADYGVVHGEDQAVRSAMFEFRDRMATMEEWLRISERYGLEGYVSY